ncbi:MAG: alpha-mannosidase, partial [Ruminococcus sp.]|nr:alpha-mannosidase [Candidatus Copronaster equi]
INPRVLKYQISRIEPYIYTDSFVIEKWDSYTGMHVSPNNIVLDDAPHTQMCLGDWWKAGYDETRYFEATVTVPDYLAGKKVYLTIDFGGEALVRINGNIVGAVSSRANSGWVHRTEILFKEPFMGGEVLNIQVEGTVDTAAFCNTAIAGGKFMEYKMVKSELVAVDPVAEKYWFDLNAAYGVYETTDDEYVKSRLFIAADDSLHELDFDMGKDKFLATVPKAAEVLEARLSEIKYDTPGEVIMAGHSHIDVAWLWTVKEVIRKTARTFSNNLSLMDVYPEFKFSQSQAVLYDFMKKYYPDIFEKIKEKVKAGQWEIIGNTWVEADTNIASGESLIRQLLYGREFFMKEFGVCSEVYSLPDCFGFTWALPQIINRSGMKYFYTSKLFYNDTNEFPVSTFRWKAHSGDEILAYLLKRPYQSDCEPEYIRMVRKGNSQNDIVDASLGMFGYGDGGGGCTYNMVERCKSLSNTPGIPAISNDTITSFFKKIEDKFDELPVWDGEMYYENHRGTFTSQAFIKKNNRRGEFRLRNAELYSVLTGIDKKDKLEEIWKILLINQFHDILPGTSIHEAMENTRQEYVEMHKLLDEVDEELVSAFNANINPQDDSVVVRNVLSWNVSSLVKVEVDDDVKGVTDCNGKAIECNFDGNIMTFYAENVPALGYKVFKLSKKSVEFDKVIATANTLENKYLKVTIDENGLLDEVYDKLADRQILTGKGNLLTISFDKPIHESAWNLEFDYQKKFWELTEADSIEVIEASAVRGVIRVVRHFNESTITQDYILELNKQTLDFETNVDWHEREKVLKAAFPVNIRNRMASCEIAHGAAEYPTHYNTSFDKTKFEFCAHKWADLSEGGYGVSILNDCKYGYNIYQNVMKITLMRGPVCPDPLGDIGINTFRYSLYPHSGTWREADTVKLGFIENNPLCASIINGSGGNDVEKSFGFISVDNVILDAVKPAQDGNGIIVRMYEAETRHSNV